MQINILKNDVKLLAAKVSRLNKDISDAGNVDDKLWDEFEKLRQELIQINATIFERLKQVKRPKPKPISYLGEGLYYQNEQFKPLIEEVERMKGYIETYENSNLEVSAKKDYIYSLRLLSQRFNRIVRQLRVRYNNRETLKITDEYDVQDLYHTLLHLYFDDIRKEEWTPSYAGKSARVDFLLKNEKTVVEIKKTRDKLEEKEVGEQLILDIKKYETHPDCKTLFCFVYDPECRIGNPAGLENDLSKKHGELEVVVIIEPKN
ncbi:MAG: hypothetical protein AAB336_09385 [Acidobacteriota bacterium]